MDGYLIVLFHMLLRPSQFYLVVFSCVVMRIYAQIYCTLLCPVWLISMKVLLFLERKVKRSQFGGEWEWRGVRERKLKVGCVL